MTNYIFTVWSVAAWLDWLYFLTNEWEVFMIKYGWKTPTTRRTRMDNPASVRQITHPRLSKVYAISSYAKLIVLLLT